ncbi:MAG: hypothetical protein ABI650_00390, partial [Dokdonella sp.]
MNDATPVRLGAAAVVELAGADAIAFAHSQFSSDVAGMSVGTWQLSAWLDPQGRARNTFLLLKTDLEQLLAWLPRGDVDAMARQLARYVFRAKVSITASNEWHHVQAAHDLSTREKLHAFDQGWRLQWPGTMRRSAILLPPANAACRSAESDHAAKQAWQLADIESGLPWLDASLDGVCTATSLGLERLAAASTSKGCYPG